MSAIGTKVSDRAAFLTLMLLSINGSVGPDDEFSVQPEDALKSVGINPKAVFPAGTWVCLEDTECHPGSRWHAWHSGIYPNGDELVVVGKYDDGSEGPLATWVWRFERSQSQ